MKSVSAFLTCALLTMSTLSSAKDINLSSYGAKADGKTKVTAVLQKAIDEVSKSGGGKVILSGGTFLTAPIELKSGVELHIEASAVLLGSPDLSDYPERTQMRHCLDEAMPRHRNIALIYADEADNIAITGRGTIDCNGRCFVKEKTQPDWTGWQFERTVPRHESVPRAVFFAGCHNVTVTDVTMTNQPAGWSYWINDCEYVVFDRCKILADVRYPNNDGIHINSSREVAVSNCFIETGDDAIVIRANNRSLRENKICEHVTVTNCTLRSWSSGVRIGWSNDGVIRNCTFSNLVIYDTSNAVSCWLPETKPDNPSNDFGREATLVENIMFSDIQMHEIYGSAIYVNLTRSELTKFAGFRNVTFNNIRCECLELPYFNGREDGAVENVTFNNCSFVKYPESQFPRQKKQHGAVLVGKPEVPVVNVHNINFNNSSITVL